jgi:hypothetical protein
MARRNQSNEQAIAGAIKQPVKKGFTLSADADRRLTTACLVEGINQSQMIERLITTHLVGYYSGRRGHGEDGKGEEVA